MGDVLNCHPLSRRTIFSSFALILLNFSATYSAAWASWSFSFWLTLSPDEKIHLPQWRTAIGRIFLRLSNFDQTQVNSRTQSCLRSAPESAITTASQHIGHEWRDLFQMVCRICAWCLVNGAPDLTPPVPRRLEQWSVAMGIGILICIAGRRH
jgi:hypothetical protein